MNFKDLRLKRVLSSLLFKSPKEDMNPRSLANLKFIFSDKKNSILFASFPKSGWHWTMDVVGYALLRHFQREIAVQKNPEKETLLEAEEKLIRWALPADSRMTQLGNFKLRDIFPQLDIDYCLHTHGHWKLAPVSGLDDAKTIFVVRNYITVLYSFYMRAQDKYSCFEDCIRGGILEKLVTFYNTWGEYIQKPHTHYRIFRFEDYKEKPIENFRNLIQYAFGIQIDKEIVEQSVNFFQFQNRKNLEFKYNKDEKEHFHFQGAKEYDRLIAKETLDFLKQYLKEKLIFDFGGYLEGKEKVSPEKEVPVNQG